MNGLKLQFPDNFFQPETRNGTLVSYERKQIWAVELDLLAEFSRVCEKNNILWFVDSGTLLGAVRHKGFIPWDDDIDVAMPRKEYEKLIKVRNQFVDPYFFQIEESDPGHLRNHAQLRNSNTTAIMEFEKNMPFNQGIFIDIFPLDNLPDDPMERNKFLHELNELEHRKSVIASVSIQYKKSLSAKGILKGLIHFFYRGKGYLKYYHLLQDKLQSYDGEETKDFGEICLEPFNEKWTVEREWYNKTVYLPFEFITVPAPQEYCKVLQHFYGNWKVFVKNESYHSNLVFDVNHSYREYVGKNHKQ